MKNLCFIYSDLLLWGGVWLFIPLGLLVVGVVSFLIFKNKKSASLEVEENPINRIQGKFNQAIAECVSKRKEQELLIRELEDIYKMRLEEIYTSYPRPKKNKSFLYQYKGKKTNSKNIADFKEYYGQKIENEVEEEILKNPSKETFTIRNNIKNKYHKVFFGTAYFYEDDYIEGLYQETIISGKEKLKEVEHQIEIGKEMIQYYTQLEKDFTHTKRNYKTKDRIDALSASVDSINQKQLYASTEMETVKRDAEHEQLVYTEFKKLTESYCEKQLSEARNEVIKENILKAKDEFRI